MKIAVLGAGAMGMLYAAMLSPVHDVIIVDRNPEKVRRIAEQGVTLIEQDGTRRTAGPRAALLGTPMQPVELLLVFVKSMGTQAALEKCQSLIDENTLLLTLQNGGGHEETLSRFVPMSRVLIGTTQHNASVQEGGVFHGGSGQTVIGAALGASEAARRVADAFSQAGVESVYTDNVRAAVWQKLMTNASLSALTGVLTVPMGFVTDSPSAWTLCRLLIEEACDVARADGVCFDPQEKIAAVRAVGVNGPLGITSICADIMNGRYTEVEAISGSVVRAAKRLGVPAPRHEMMVLLVHALEDKNVQMKR